MTMALNDLSQRDSPEPFHAGRALQCKPCAQVEASEQHLCGDPNTRRDETTSAARCVSIGAPCSTSSIHKGVARRLLTTRHERPTRCHYWRWSRRPLRGLLCACERLSNDHR